MNSADVHRPVKTIYVIRKFSQFPLVDQCVPELLCIVNSVPPRHSCQD